MRGNTPPIKADLSRLSALGVNEVFEGRGASAVRRFS